MTETEEESFDERIRVCAVVAATAVVALHYVPDAFLNLVTSTILKMWQVELGFVVTWEICRVLHRVIDPYEKHEQVPRCTLRRDGLRSPLVSARRADDYADGRDGVTVKFSSRPHRELGVDPPGMCTCSGCLVWDRSGRAALYRMARVKIPGRDGHTFIPDQHAALVRGDDARAGRPRDLRTSDRVRDLGLHRRC